MFCFLSEIHSGFMLHGSLVISDGRTLQSILDINYMIIAGGKKYICAV